MSSRSWLSRQIMPPLLVLASAACSQADFTGDSRKAPAKPPTPLVETLALGCYEEGKRSTAELVASTGAPARLTFQGSFCPDRRDELTVLFVVDFSGSMGRHVSQGTGEESAGNDPQKDQACGRLAAASAIVEKLASEMDYGEVVRVGMIPFAGGVLSQRVIAPLELEIFEERLTAETFCAHVGQAERFGYHPENPGALRPSEVAGIDASTNYRAAFDAASRMLVQARGRRVVYFVSDGEPTSGGQDPALAGIEAGRALREQGAILNGLLLGDGGAEARGLLEEVTGDPERVRLAARAEDLAKEILKFPKPRMEPLTLELSLTQDGGSERVLGVESFAEVSAASGKSTWKFVSEEFELPPGSGRYHLRARAQDHEGKTHRLDLTVTLTRTP